MLPQKALALWNLPPSTKITLLAQRENLVYRLDIPDEAPTVLRIHRKHYRSNCEIVSELQWMLYLAQQGIRVPEPMPTKRNTLVETIEGHQIDRLSWLDGHPLNITGMSLDFTDREATYRQIGQVMAKLHLISDDWVQPKRFSRPQWDKNGLLGEQPLWDRFWENPQLTNDQRHTILRAREKATNDLTKKGLALDYGLIHADLVQENMLLGVNGIQLLDFDDGGFGYRLFEIATPLLKIRSEPDSALLEAALIGGYQTVRSLDVKELPLFLLLRSFTYVGWIIQRMDESGSSERCGRFINTAVVLAENYLSSEC